MSDFYSHFVVVHYPDLREPDPADKYLEQIDLMRLEDLIESVNTAVGEDAYRILRRFLSTDAPSLRSIAGELKLTSGHLFHEWRKVLAFLRQQLFSKDL